MRFVQHIFKKKLSFQDKKTERSIIVKNISNTSKKIVFERNYLEEAFSQLPIFDALNFFWLETLGEGGSSVVQRAYDKRNCEFIAIKKFNKINTNPQNKKAIMLEDDMLQTIEKFRAGCPENEQHFLKYYGVFKDSEDPNTFW